MQCRAERWSLTLNDEKAVTHGRLLGRINLARESSLPNRGARAWLVHLADIVRVAVGPSPGATAATTFGDFLNVIMSGVYSGWSNIGLCEEGLDNSWRISHPHLKSHLQPDGESTLGVWLLIKCLSKVSKCVIRHVAKCLSEMRGQTNIS